MKEGLGVGRVAVPQPSSAGPEKAADADEPEPCTVVFIRVSLKDNLRKTVLPLKTSFTLE